jgi:hypothetical protein
MYEGQWQAARHLRSLSVPPPEIATNRSSGHRRRLASDQASRPRRRPASPKHYARSLDWSGGTVPGTEPADEQAQPTRNHSASGRLVLHRKGGRATTASNQQPQENPGLERGGGRKLATRSCPSVTSITNGLAFLTYHWPQVSLRGTFPRPTRHSAHCKVNCTHAGAVAGLESNLQVAGRGCHGTEYTTASHLAGRRVGKRVDLCVFD